MKITSQEQVAIAHCLQQVANAIATNPNSSVSLGYQDGMERSGQEPLAEHQLRDLAERVFSDSSLLNPLQQKAEELKRAIETQPKRRAAVQRVLEEQHRRNHS